jgi:LysM repeat protein
LRVWTKSACVVLAWSLLLTLAVAVSLGGSAPRTQASIRNASSTTAITLTSTVHVAAAPATARPAARYVVQPGDTLSGIAAAFAVRGGWPALYAANRNVIGPDPGVIRPGTVLVLPGRAVQTRYTVEAGDTLSGIAAALAVRGGWPALYAANRRVIGSNPDVIHPGTVLVLPGALAPSSAAPARSSAPPAPSSARPHAAAPRAPAGHGQRALPTRTSAPAAMGMPRWLRLMLVALGLLIGAAFVTELVLAVVRRRRQAVAARSEAALAAQPQAALAARPETAPATPPTPPMSSGRFVVADYDRLVVTHCRTDDKVYVLRPPDADPRAILRVARLVLTEDPYEELAGQLGVPASWPAE